MKKIIDRRSRAKLKEGRNYGIGFSILKKINDNKYTTYIAFTACRDYLNDFAYVESTKSEIGNAHGYTHKVLNCFEEQEVFYLGVNTLHYNQKPSKDWENFEQGKKLLIENYSNLEKLLNLIEIELGIPLSKIELDEDVLIIKAPIYWSRSAPLISIYTLLIRCFFNLTEDELNQDTINILRKHKVFVAGDKYMPEQCAKYFEQVLKDKSVFDRIDYDELQIDEDVNSIHNFGIVGFMNCNHIYNKKEVYETIS